MSAKKETPGTPSAVLSLPLAALGAQEVPGASTGTAPPGLGWRRRVQPHPRIPQDSSWRQSQVPHGSESPCMPRELGPGCSLAKQLRRRAGAPEWGDWICAAEEKAVRKWETLLRPPLAPSNIYQHGIWFSTLPVQGNSSGSTCGIPPGFFVLIAFVPSRTRGCGVPGAHGSSLGTICGHERGPAWPSGHGGGFGSFLCEFLTE